MSNVHISTCTSTASSSLLEDPPKDPRQAALALGRPRRPNESAEWHAQCRRPQTIFATTSIDSSFTVRGTTAAKDIKRRIFYILYYIHILHKHFSVSCKLLKRTTRSCMILSRTKSQATAFVTSATTHWVRSNARFRLALFSCGKLIHEGVWISWKRNMLGDPHCILQLSIGDSYGFWTDSVKLQQRSVDFNWTG